MEIAVVEGPPEDVEADILAFPVLDPAGLGRAGEALDRALHGRLRHLVADGELTGKRGRVTLVHTLGEIGAHRVAAAGIGRSERADADALRTAAARVTERSGRIGGGVIAWALDRDLDIAVHDQARALVDGTVLGGYDPARWKTSHDPPKPVERLVLFGEGADAVSETARRCGVAADWANRCRDLVNAPANELTPQALGARAAEIGGSLPHVRLEELGPDEIRAEGMGAFLSVAQGSQLEPRLIVIEYEPPGAPSDMCIGLVGKAVTFDSGGLSLKPGERMDEMKSDMGGGAAVLCGLAAVASLELPVRLLAVIPATENMPSGTAIRPGDIVTALSGKTIEITNTDAEGRLLLADALTYARRRGATHLLDLATLTGAIVLALGDFYAGLMGNDETWVSQVGAAAEASGDHAWRLPVHDTYRRLIRSTFADMKNSSSLRQAAPVYAASFLAEFAGEGAWAHLDIAGTAYLSRGREDYYTDKGATGYGVRLIAELAASLGG